MILQQDIAQANNYLDTLKWEVFFRLVAFSTNAKLFGGHRILSIEEI